MRRLLPLSLLLIIPIALSACGGGGGGQSATSQDIPAAGGTVSLGSNVTLRIPPGALTAPAKVTITKKNAPDGALAGGQSLGSGYSIDLGGQKLAKPVTLEIAFDPKMLPKGSAAAQAFLSYYDEAKKTWVPVGGTVDTQRNVIVVQTDHLSWWNPFSWNWEAWLAVLHDTLSLKLSGWANAVHLLTSECSRTGQHASVSEAQSNNVIQGCVVADDAAHPQFKIVNVKSFYLGISPAATGPGYPEATLLAPGEAKEFTANATDASPAVVSADFSGAAIPRFAVAIAAQMLPGGDSIPSEGIAVIADGVSRVVSAVDFSDALQRRDAHAATDALYQIITSESFIETLAQVAADYGRTNGIDMLSRWTATGLRQVFRGVALTDVAISTVDFAANYLFNNRSEVAFIWRAAPHPVTAIGEFMCRRGGYPTCDGYAPAAWYSASVTLHLDLAGGPVSGTGHGEDASGSPSCGFLDTSDFTFEGMFDRQTGELSGTVAVGGRVTVTRGGELPVCQQVAGDFNGGIRRVYEWNARLLQDGMTIEGTVATMTVEGEGTSGAAPFRAAIS